MSQALGQCREKAVSKTNTIPILMECGCRRVFLGVGFNILGHLVSWHSVRSRNLHFQQLSRWFGCIPQFKTTLLVGHCPKKAWRTHDGSKTVIQVKRRQWVWLMELHILDKPMVWLWVSLNLWADLSYHWNEEFFVGFFFPHRKQPLWG